MTNRYAVYATALLTVLALPTTAQASVVINSIGTNPGALTGNITLAGHFTDLAVNIGRFSLGGVTTPGNTPVNFLSYCGDLLGTLGNGTFEIKPLSVLVSDPVKQAQLAALLTLKDPLITGTTANDKNISAAIQLSVWEIISESSGTYSLSSGLFKASGTNADTLTLAQTYLTGVTSGGWMAVPGKTVQVLYSPTNQSQLIIGSVPEPATWTMMVGGFALVGGALRTRRRGTMAAKAVARAQA